MDLENVVCDIHILKTVVKQLVIAQNINSSETYIWSSYPTHKMLLLLVHVSISSFTHTWYAW